MPDEARRAVRATDPESGVPGGGTGRTDVVGGSGVYPASAGSAPADAVVRTQAAWGQGDRGAEGYEDSGTSELYYYPAQLEAAEAAEAPPAAAPADDPPESPPHDPGRLGRGWGGW